MTSLNLKLSANRVRASMVPASALSAQTPLRVVQRLSNSVPNIAVIGSGLAGVSAAIEAKRLAEQTNGGVAITILEKEHKPGGNSAKASSGFSAYDPTDPSDRQDYLQDTLTSARGSGNQQLTATLVEHSAQALDFLKSLGVDLSQVSQLGGHSHKRTHSNPAGANVGHVIMSQLTKHLQAMPDVTMMLNAKVDHILLDTNGKVVGVHHTPCDLPDGPGEDLSADAVIIATGGFGASHDLLAKYCPATARFGTTNGPGTTGDGMVFGHSAGAKLIDMDKVQLHPTSFVDPANPDATTKFLAPEKLRGVGGLLFNMDGRRFVDELQRRDVIAEAIMAQPEGKAYIVLSSVAAETFSMAAIGFYLSKGLMHHVDNLEGVAAHMGVPAATISEQLRRYNDAVYTGQDQHGKTVFPGGSLDLSRGAYVATVTPAVHYCMGGLAINAHAQVLNEVGEPIPAMFAAGEVTGGVHGNNRLAGNSLTDCVVFGRLAARSAMQYISANTRPPN